jgi:hypothetical protein
MYSGLSGYGGVGAPPAIGRYGPMGGNLAQYLQAQEQVANATGALNFANSYLTEEQRQLLGPQLDHTKRVSEMGSMEAYMQDRLASKPLASMIYKGVTGKTAGLDAGEVLDKGLDVKHRSWSL